MKLNRNIFCVILLLFFMISLTNNIIFASAYCFEDVDSESWYFEAVDFVSQKEWMIGTSNTEFAPSMSLSRAMFTTALYRMAGSPNGYYPNVFVDVSDTGYYSKAVGWAYANNIVKGTSDKSFNPHRNITREEMVTILYRYADFQGFNLEIESTLTEFSDYQKISDYAIDPMTWAIDTGLINGTTNTLLEPQAQTNRAQCATIIWRFYEKVYSNWHKDFYNVKDYGVIADGITDDTKAINDLIKEVPDGSTIYFPDGIYLVSTSDKYSAIKISEKNNLTISLSNNATIKHATTDSEFYYIVHIWRCNGVTINGGNIEGEANTHPCREDTLENNNGNIHGYGIRLSDSTNSTVRNVQIYNCYGDGICISSDSNPNIGCDGVLIEGCEIHDIFRNGITISSCRDIDIVNCNIYDIFGVNPKAGIDIEAEHIGSVNGNIKIENSYVEGDNYSIAASLIADNITIVNSNLQGHMPVAKDISNVTIYDSIIDSIGISSVNEVTIHSSTIQSLLLVGGHCTVQDCNFIADSQTTQNVNIYKDGGTAEFVNCQFKASDIQDVSFFNVRNNKTADYLVFTNCIFDTRCQRYGMAFSGTMNIAEFDKCTFRNSESTWDQQWMQITANNLTMNNCVFDATTLKFYTNYSSLLKLNATNLRVMNCEIKIADSIPPCKYAFSSNGKNVTGDVYYIYNIISGWTSLGRMPTNANFVAYGNIFGNTDS